MDIAKYIDHTNLKSTATFGDIERLCEEARKYGFYSVCVNPYYVSLCKRLLSGTDVKVCTVIGFPLGATTTSTKVFETEETLKMGCDEFDMVINVGMLKSGKDDHVMQDIRQVVEAAKDRTVKVIIETGLLTDEEKMRACRLASQAGAHFVKTCTGMTQGKALVEDIDIMKKNIVPGVKIKASGGIRTYEDAIKLIEAGSDRIGTSSGVEIVNNGR